MTDVRNDWCLSFNWSQDQWKFQPHQSFLSIGSCFSENIGKNLKDDLLEVVINPNGIIYNPYSIVDLLLRVVQQKQYQIQDVVEVDGYYFSWHHHSRIMEKNPHDVLEKVNLVVKQTYDFLLQQHPVILVTPGTMQVYYHHESSQVVSNCHQFPSHAFQKQYLDIDATYNHWKELLAYLPHHRFIFTISPVRYLREGLIESNNSKAMLRVFIEKLRQSFPDRVVYFPSFEYINDVLRDYRFYNDDMLHPSPQAVKYVYRQFIRHFFDASSQDYFKEWEDIKKMLNHKLTRPDSENYQKFITNMKYKLKIFKEKWNKDYDIPKYL
jgi:hypothetical protein